MYPTKLKAKYKGILLIVSAAFCFACMAAFVRLSGDLPTFQKSFFRNFIALIVATAILAREGKGFRPASGKNWPFLLARAAFGTAGVLMNFYAVDHLLLADATMLNKMSPFFAVIASYFILKENISPVQGLSLVGAFVGALFIVKPSFSNMDLGASLIGLLGGLGAGLAYTFVRLLGKKGERKSYIVFEFSAFSCLSALPFVLADPAPMTAKQVACLVIAGLFAAGGQFSVTGAYSYAPARELSVYDYSQVIFSALLGFFMFGDVPDVYSFLGYFIICGMAGLTFWYNNHHLPTKERA